MSTEVIWDDFSRELLSFIQSRVRNKEAAEDLLQEVFVKIHLKLDSLQKKNRLSSWVYQITRNTIIDYYRKQKSQVDENVQLESFIPEILGEELKEVPKDFSKCIQSFSRHLPEDYQHALRHTLFGKMSQKEYAEQYDLTYSTAKSRVQRAKKKLKETFVECCQVQTDKYGNLLSHNCGCF